jgi:hypothetical protein
MSISTVYYIPEMLPTNKGYCVSYEEKKIKAITDFREDFVDTLLQDQNLWVDQKVLLGFI